MKKVKKLLSFMLALLIAFTSIQVTGIKSCAAAKVWNGKADTSWYTGDLDYYEISTAEQLAGLAKLSEKVSFEGVTITLTADIKLNDTKKFSKWEKKAPKRKWKTMIGSKSCPFKGTFNGQGHKIEGLYLKDNKQYSNWLSSWYADGGLFGYLQNATIVNLKMKNCYIETPGTNGIISSRAQNSFLMGVEVTDAVIKGGTAGGMIGAINYDYSDLYNSYLAYIAMGAIGGVWFNPLLFGDSLFLPNDFSGTIIYSSIVNKLTFKNNDIAGGMVASGGASDTGIGIANCLVANTSFKTNNTKGVFLGVKPSKDNAILKNCYKTDVTIDKKSKNRKFIDSKSVKNMKKTTLYKSGAKKLGKAFKKTGKMPKLKLFKPASQVADTSKYKTIADGYYTISYGERYLAINDENDVVMSSEPQRFKFTYYPAGFYTISTDDGRGITGLTDNDDVLAEKKPLNEHRFTQKWEVQPKGDNYYIYLKNTNKFIANLDSFMFIPGQGVHLDHDNFDDESISYNAIWQIKPAN